MQKGLVNGSWMAVVAAVMVAACGGDDASSSKTPSPQMTVRFQGLQAHAGHPLVARIVDPAFEGTERLVADESTTVDAQGVATVTFSADLAGKKHVIDWFVDANHDGRRTLQSNGRGEVGWRDAIAPGDTLIERDVSAITSGSATRRRAPRRRRAASAPAPAAPTRRAP
jgi:hypothetical protein